MCFGLKFWKRITDSIGFLVMIFAIDHCRVLMEEEEEEEFYSLLF